MLPMFLTPRASAPLDPGWGDSPRIWCLDRQTATVSYRLLDRTRSSPVRRVLQAFRINSELPPPVQTPVPRTGRRSHPARNSECPLTGVVGLLTDHASGF